MASENDIFRKMDALLRKHHPGANGPSDASTPDLEPPPVTVLSASQSAATQDIPLLTEVVEAHAPDNQPDQDLIPVLTETIDIDHMESGDFPLELDLDPYYATAIQPDTFAESPDAFAESEEKASAPASGPAPEPLAAESGSFPELPEIEFEDSLAIAEPAGQPIDVLPAPESMVAPFALEQDIIEPTAHKQPAESAAQISDSLSEQIMRAVHQQLQKAVDTSIAPQIANSVDKALSSMLDQFSIHIEYMVQEAITKELQKHLSALHTLANDKTTAGPSSNSSAQTGDSV